MGPLGRRRIDAAFDGGHVSSDGGVLLLRETARRTGFFERIAACFTDRRDQRYVEHSVEDLVKQRILGLALGYEDLNDHDLLRRDPLFALAVGKSDPSGQTRRKEQDAGFPLAGHATLSRLETAPADVSAKRRDLKIFHDPTAFERLFVDLFLEAHREAPQEIVLDIDTTDDPVHGKQEGGYYQGHYRHYCYLPLYIFCEDFLLVAKLREGNQGPASGALKEVQRVVEQIRARWPAVRILLRGDAGFSQDELMKWCEEAEGVDYVFGLARNARLQAAIEQELATNEIKVGKTGEATRSYKDFRYRTLRSWSCERRVVGKAEVLVGKRNPRFIVTSVPEEQVGTRGLYEEVYCARGDMENRIKEQQLGLFADRTSSHTMRANQLRLWFSSLAYALMNQLRMVALAGTTMAKAQVWTIRTQLLKVGAVVWQSVRRMRIALSSAFPLQEVWFTALNRLAQTNGSLAM